MRRTRSSFLAAIIAVFAGGASMLLGICGPFTDVAADAFCPFVLEIYYLGITAGTTATTYDPTSNVTRLQMAAFLSRTVDSALKRGSRRASLNQAWSAQNSTVLGLTTVGSSPLLLKSDGADIWVANTGSSSVSRVRASDGKLLETWTGATNAFGVLAVMGRIFVSGATNPGTLYRIDPSQTAGAVETVASNVGIGAEGIAFDGARIWTANGNGSVSIVTPGASIPWTVTTVSIGLELNGAVFDGTNVWVTEVAGPPGRLDKLDANGAVLQSVSVGTTPLHPVFDGTNIWVPNGVFGATVVRASNGAILTTITDGLPDGGAAAAFDGQRVLITRQNSDSVSLYKAADLTFLGSVTLANAPFGACSDGVNFWIALENGGKIARF